jgi:2-C-methyl-D-erythritol 4-phosphate cytidylyltransferase
MNYALVVAAGAGVRFGGHKQYFKLGGKPLVFHSLLAFERCPAVKETVLVTNVEMIDRAELLIRKWGFRKVNWVVAGGPERQDSVARGLRILPDTGMVAIHDGVRPFLTPERIAQGFRTCRRSKAVVFALPCGETIKAVVNALVTETVPRDGLFLVQTPQFFSLPLIKHAVDQAFRDGFYGTDDAQLVERSGGKVAILPGWRENIKITTRADLKFAEELL